MSKSERLKVFVYYNLHKKCWSVKALNGDMRGRVILHADEVWLTDVTFRVSKAGRERVLKERRKNVHAGVVGYLSAANDIDSVRDNIRYAYNPYTCEQFVTIINGIAQGPAGNPSAVLMKDKRVYHATKRHTGTPGKGLAKIATSPTTSYESDTATVSAFRSQS
jgi:hypothetical protein